MAGFSLWTAGMGLGLGQPRNFRRHFILTFRDSGKANILTSIRHSYLSGKELVLRAGFDEEKGRETGERMWAIAWGWYHGRNFKLQAVNGCWKRHYGINKPLLLHHTLRSGGITCAPRPALSPPVTEPEALLILAKSAAQVPRQQSETLPLLSFSAAQMWFRMLHSLVYVGIRTE